MNELQVSLPVYIGDNPNVIVSDIHDLYYGIGKQSPLQLCYTCTDADGEKRFGKWLDFEFVQQYPEYLKIANNRTIFPHELVIDIDPGKVDLRMRLYRTIRRLDWCDATYAVWHTGSRGYHIHMLFPELECMYDRERTRLKRRLLVALGGEWGKCSPRCMTALENRPHWKTGRMKTLVYERVGERDNCSRRLLWG
jgi:hypothetical protein